MPNNHWSGQNNRVYYFLQVESYRQNIASVDAAQAHFEGEGHILCSIFFFFF